MSEEITDKIENYSVEEIKELINHFKDVKLFGMVKRYERFLEEKLKNS
jgi:hypothetical protein